MKYEVDVFLKDVLVLTWNFKSITQVCRFLDNADMSLLEFLVLRIDTNKSIDVDALMKIWRIDNERR